MPKRPVIESAHVAFTDHRIQRRPKTRTSQVEGVKLRSDPAGELDDPMAATRNLGFAYAEVAGSTGKQEFFGRVVELLRPLIGTKVTDAVFWQTLGEAHLAVGEIARSREAFRNAVDLDSGSSSAHYSLGYLLQRRNDLPAAIEAYRRAVAADPYKAEAFGNLAAAYFKMGEHGEGARSIEIGVGTGAGQLNVEGVAPAAIGETVTLHLANSA